MLLFVRLLGGPRAIQTEYIIMVQVEMVEVWRHWFNEGLIILLVTLLYDNREYLLPILTLAVLSVLGCLSVIIGRG